MKNIKTAKGRKIASTKWLERQINDPFKKQAQKFGYRSRAAYKLIEINDKYKFILPGKTIVDLGSAPGSWSQVVESIIGNTGKIIAVDIIDMLPIPNVMFINKSIEDCLDDFLTINVDVIISDMAPHSSGSNELDHIRSMNLCMMCLDFAQKNLISGGVMLIKIFQGYGEMELCCDLRKLFSSVKYIKPKASRKESAEIYIFAQNFKTSIL